MIVVCRRRCSVVVAFIACVVLLSPEDVAPAGCFVRAVQSPPAAPFEDELSQPEADQKKLKQAQEAEHASAAVVESDLSKASTNVPAVEKVLSEKVLEHTLDSHEPVKAVVDKLIVGGSHEAQSRAAINAGSYAALAAGNAGFPKTDTIKAAAAAAQQVVLGRVLHGSSWNFKKLHSELVWPALVAARSAGASENELALLAQKHLRIALVWQEIVRSGFAATELQDMRAAAANAKRVGQMQGQWTATGIATTAAEAAAARMAWELGSPAIGSLDNLEVNQNQQLGFLHRHAIEHLQEAMTNLDLMFQSPNKTAQNTTRAASLAMLSEEEEKATSWWQWPGMPGAILSAQSEATYEKEGNASFEREVDTAKLAPFSSEADAASEAGGDASSIEVEFGSGGDGGSMDESDTIFNVEQQFTTGMDGGLEEDLGGDLLQRGRSAISSKTVSSGEGASEVLLHDEILTSEEDALTAAMRYLDNMLAAARYIWDDGIQEIRRLSLVAYMQALASRSQVQKTLNEFKSSWGPCATTEGSQCVFPFMLNGVRYDRCAFASSNFFWCSTKIDANGSHVDGYWGRCNYACGLLPSTSPELGSPGNGSSLQEVSYVDSVVHAEATLASAKLPDAALVEQATNTLKESKRKSASTPTAPPTATDEGAGGANISKPKLTLRMEAKFAAAAANAALWKEAADAGRMAASQISDAAVTGKQSPRAALRTESLEIETAVFSARQLAQNIVLGWLPGFEAGAMGFVQLLAKNVATAAQRAAGLIAGRRARAWAAKASRRSWWDTKGELALGKYYLRIVRLGILVLSGQRASGAA